MSINIGSGHSPEQEPKVSTTPLSRLELAAELLARVAARCASSGVPKSTGSGCIDNSTETDAADQIAAERCKDSLAPPEFIGAEAP